jgi:hypothetical protein
MEPEIPPAILSKHPELASVSEALNQYRQGRPVTASCPKCRQPLSVVEVEETGELWVSCPNGCTSLRAQRARKE